MNDNEFQYAEEGTSSDSAPDVNENVETREHEGQTTEATEQELADLSAYSRFKVGEKEYTRDQLDKGIMYQSDYTKKTQEIAQERKFYANLPADLDQVRRNPALAAEFQKIYPKSFHKFLSYVSKEQGQQTSQNVNAQRPNANAAQQQINDPRFEKVLSTVERLEQERQEERISQRATEIDSAFTKFRTKYPLSCPTSNEYPDGDENFVLNRAQAVLNSLQPGEKMTDDKWEKIFKQANAHYTKAFESHYKNMNNNQKAAHVRGKDIGSGGGIPGGAPKMPRSIREAAQIAEEDLIQRRRQ